MSDRRRDGARWLAAVLSATLLLRAGALAAGPPPPAGTPDDRAAARERAERGYELVKQQNWAAALAEFQESRRRYPLLAATSLAALCLKNLGRFDEALDMYATLLRDFGDKLTPREKKEALEAVEETRRFVGTIEVDESEPGATIAVDRQERGVYPLLAPLRVAAGSHIVRVYEEGFEPFERRLDVAGGTTAHVTARLVRLRERGTLQVIESQGRELAVVVDGIAVGKTSASPLLVPLAPGKHVVLLRGEGDLGTVPSFVTIVANEVAPLRVEAEALDASLRVAPEPFDAFVAIDSVTLGRGLWDGRVRSGPHTIEVAAEGFLPETRKVTVARGAHEVVAVQLARDPRSAFAGRASHFTVEVTVAPVFAPLFGGDVATSCDAQCSATPGYGGYVLARGGDELGSGIGFGITAGYLAATQSVRSRSTMVTPVNRFAEGVVADDSIWLHGALLGAWGGFSFGARVPLHFRLGAGALLGAASDTRSASGVKATTVPAGEEHAVHAFYVAPEVRVGLAVSKHVEISAGVEMLVAFLPSPPRWERSHDVILQPPAGSALHLDYGTFPPDSFVGTILAISPGLAARYTF